jgi:hypothetical protein
MRIVGIDARRVRWRIAPGVDRRAGGTPARR